MVVKILPIDTIISDPTIRNGRPVIAGTEIMVSSIAMHHINDKQTPEELAAGFLLSPAQIHAALAYYYLHKDNIHAEVAENDAKAEALFKELALKGRAKRFE